MAYDPRIDDAKNDPALAKWTNERLQKSIAVTRQHMDRGSMPQFVLRHATKEGTPAPDIALGPVSDLWYEERDGVGYAVADAEFNEDDFAALIESNRYPRRSAEFWPDNDHMSEIALLGRDTPRRALPDSHFDRKGAKAFFGKTRFDYAGIGGGANTFVPTAGRKNDEMTTEERLDKLENALSGMSKQLNKLCGEKEDAPKDENKKSLGSIALTVDAPADTVSRAEFNSAVLALEATKVEMAKVSAEAAKEKFGRVVDALVNQDGIAIKDEDREGVIARIAGAADPAAEIDYIKRNFQKMPLRQEIKVQFAALPGQKVSPEQIKAKAEEFAKTGDTEGFQKWMRDANA